MSYYYYPPYVSVAERRRKAGKLAKKMEKQGKKLAPIELSGRKITTTFWGDSWCKNLESYSDYENRLPRGRTYVRNGSVIDLKIESGRVTALVSGTDVYEIDVDIKPISKKKWNKIVELCAGEISSLVELLQGSLSKNVMEIVTLKSHGLFPSPGEISMDCSCPDWASLCKHLAAVLYGVGSRLDNEPELLFKLRGVDPLDLVEAAMDKPIVDEAHHGEDVLDSDELSSVFGIDIDMSEEKSENEEIAATKNDKEKAKASSAKTKPVKKKVAAKAKKTAATSAASKKSSTTTAKTATTTKRTTNKRVAAKKVSASKATTQQKPKATKVVSKKSVTKTTATKTKTAKPTVTKANTAKTSATKAKAAQTATPNKAKSVKSKTNQSNRKETNLSDKKITVKFKEGEAPKNVFQKTLLNESEVLEIRNAFKEGESKSSLARRFGSTPSTITNVIHGLKAYAQY